MNRFNNRISIKKQALKLTDTLLWLFVKIFKAQLGAPLNAQTKIEPVSHSEGIIDPDQIYTMRVFHQGAWKSRRITIGELGSNVANKSTCFRVIYDDLLVIKVPPHPVTSIDEYAKAIRSEGQIASQTLPDILCVVPSLSAILVKIIPTQGNETLSFEEMENHYLRRITEDPSLQQYLKIGDSFAFFMNLSRYAFLNQIADTVNEHTPSVIPQIIAHLDMLSGYSISDITSSDPKGELFFEMKCLLDEYLNQIQDLIETWRIRNKFSGSQIKEWLVSHLIGTQIRRKNGDIPESFFQELIQLFDSITRERRSTIEAYVASVVGDSEKALIERQDIKKRGLLVNILSLWGNLKNHRLAIRDLKPENIFVSADLSQSDRILSEPSKYSLGLIDLETALKLPGEPAVKPDQPVRTGTPAYATPSHLFPNEILHLLLGNLHRTFYLQDQYSIIGLLFYSATGKILFENTGKLLPEIVMAAQKNRLKNQSLTDLFKHVSWVFWHSAITEFEQKRLEHENLLNRLEIHLPQHTAILLQKDIQDTQRDLLDRINRLLNSQHTLKNSPTLDALNRAKGLAIRRQREKMEKEENTGGDVELLNRKIHFLFTLEYLKTMRETIERITGAFPTLLLDKLLMLLFSLILAFMYRENWSDRNPPVFSSTLIDSV